MGNQAKRAEAGVDQVTGGLIGENLLDVLKAEILQESVFRTIFRDSIFMDELVNHNETRLPAWEFFFDKELIEGGDLRHIGSINSRILFPEEFNGKFAFHRRLALTIGRFFKAPRTVLFDAVPGLTHFGQDLDITYDQLFVAGGMKVPSIIIKIPFVFDVRRYRLASPCVDLDAALDADLIKQFKILIEISGNALGENTVLIPKDQLK